MQRTITTSKCRDWSRVEGRILLFTLLTLSNVAALADIYRWVDKDGRIHYSDKPSSQFESRRVRTESTDVPKQTDEGEALRRLREQSEQATKNRSEAQRARSAAEQAANEERLAQEQRCLKARKQLAVLQEQLPVYRDEKGEFRAKWSGDTYQGKREYLDNATRASEVKVVRQNIATYCENPDNAKAQELATKKWRKSEHCAAARADLEALARPQARTSQQTLDEKRQFIEKNCKE